MKGAHMRTRKGANEDFFGLVILLRIYIKVIDGILFPQGLLLLWLLFAKTRSSSCNMVRVTGKHVF